MQKSIPTALIGFGKMAQGYAKDSVMARFYPYSTHAQVLRDHSAYDWQVVVDPDPCACRSAREDWQVPIVSQTLEELGEASHRIEIVVIATPPNERLNILKRFPNLRAVLVEKPVGVDLASSEYFVMECKKRGLLLQVNLWRRADRALRSLANGKLLHLVGNVQAAFAVYGNGLNNNGIHMIDMVSMLFGDVCAVQRIATLAPFQEGPIRNDINCAFALETESGTAAMFFPLRFGNYRENGLCLWGERGRLDILNEGLTIHHYERCANRAMSGEDEIASDNPTLMLSTVGDALFEMYSNLANALGGKADLWSSGASALKTARTLEAVKAASVDGKVHRI
ncbi:Gfo/Idh/MocA family oxidoreductase [Gammaproteobacteria bacterium]|nr:Gfo/Idh/MocA family oxidoreductase [Gammaproteobacteria bacterium]